MEVNGYFYVCGKVSFCLKIFFKIEQEILPI